MRKLFQIALVVLFVCLSSGARAEMLNALNVVVNDSVITLDEVRERLLPLLQTAAELHGPNTPTFLKEQERLHTNVLQEMIDRKLILAEFSKGYNLPESFLDDLVNEDIKKTYGDRVHLIETLQARGKSYETYRQEQREGFIIDYMKHEKTSSKKIVISPKHIEDYYTAHQEKFKVSEQVKLRMIVVDQPAAAAPGTARKMASDILRQLDQGTPFAELASLYSSGPYRSEGGDRGWIDHSAKFAPELMNTAFSLKPGQHSGIIEMPNACYLLQVDDARPAHVKSLTEAEVRTEIEETLKTQQRAELYNRWLERLRRQAFVDLY